jgi:hypothetical protein
LDSEQLTDTILPMDLRLHGKPDVDKAKNIVCAVVAASGGQFHGKTRLNKAFWRAHVVHYHKQNGLLSSYPIARLPEGPAIDDYEDLLVVLEREGRIELGQREESGYVETTITLKSQPPILDEGEMASINEAVAWVRPRTAQQVSRESHESSLSWQKKANGELLEIAFDALDASEVDVRRAEEKKIAQTVEWARKAVAGMFG